MTAILIVRRIERLIIAGNPASPVRFGNEAAPSSFILKEAKHKFILDALMEKTNRVVME